MEPEVNDNEELSPEEARLYEEFKLAIHGIYHEAYLENLTPALEQFHQEREKALESLRSAAMKAAETMNASAMEMKAGAGQLAAQMKLDTEELTNQLKTAQAAVLAEFEANAKKLAASYTEEARFHANNVSVKIGIMIYAVAFFLILLLGNLFITAYLVRLVRT